MEGLPNKRSKTILNIWTFPGLKLYKWHCVSNCVLTETDGHRNLYNWYKRNMSMHNETYEQRKYKTCEQILVEHGDKLV